MVPLDIPMDAGGDEPRGSAGNRRARPIRIARTLAAAAVMVPGCLPALAVQPIPLVTGVYCGPGDATIVIDAARDQVTIDGQVCRFPVIAADRLQSNACSTDGGRSASIVVDFRVVGPAFVHDGAWYRRCGNLPSKTP